MTGKNKKYCIYGTGGSAKDVLVCLIDELKASNSPIDGNILFIEADNAYSSNSLLGIPIIKQSEFKLAEHKLLIAVGSSSLREKVVNEFPKETEFFTTVHPSAILSKWVEVGAGSVISAGCILTCDIKIGNHAQLNLKTSITHDFKAGSFFTTAPGVSISGNCTFGDRVYFGTNSCSKQGITVSDDVVIGMGASVITNISAPGTYVGTPAKIIS